MSTSFPITLLPSGETVNARTGASLLEVLRERLGVRADCGGRGVCGKCRVFIEQAESPAQASEVERQQISRGLIEAGCRLACQVMVSGSMKIRLAPAFQDSDHVEAKSILKGPYKTDPIVHRRALRRKPAVDPNAGSDVGKTVSPWVEQPEIHGQHPLRCTLDTLLQQVPPDILDVTAICRDDAASSAVVKGQRPDSLGLAVDIGTTTLAAYLCDLGTGNILSSAAALNPQRRYGDDVISRIQAASASAQNLAALQRLVVSGVQYLAEQCLSRAGKSAEDVDDVVVAGNTAMQHIFAGIDPGSLGRSPFEPVAREALHLPADQLGFAFSPGTRVFVMPVIAGFAGGDTVACALAERIHHRKEISLIVDVGTNGELVLGNEKGLWSTSCATGPAFEGAQIACGMRATSGAICACSYDEAKRGFRYRTIGDHGGAPPLGFCGSGIIDAVLALRNAGALLPSGQLTHAEPTDEECKIAIVPAFENPAGVDVFVTQRDIRQVQLAKAALASGVICLLEKAGLRRVDRTVLTGAFGHAFNWQHAVAIGMLPDAAVLGEVCTKNNLAGEGAVMALLDRKQRIEAEAVRRQILYLNLAEEAGFIRHFVAQTLFP
jgi:uncharacterized 2Fe-2S/4Fe-4S cluster protein (DUF4445 family)